MKFLFFSSLFVFLFFTVVLADAFCLLIRSILKIKISQILNIRQQFSLAQFYFWWLQFYLRKSIQKQLASAIKMSFYSWWLFSGDSSFLRALCISDGLQVSKCRSVLTKFPFLILFNSWGLSRMMSHQRRLLAIIIQSSVQATSYKILLLKTVLQVLSLSVLYQLKQKRD